MKTFVLSSFALFLFIASGQAQNKQERTEKATLKVTRNNVVTNFKYTSLIDFKNNSDAIMNDAGKTSAGLDDGSCTVTIEMTVSVTVNASEGVVGGAVTTTVSSSCSGAVAAAKKLRDQLIARTS